MILKPHWLPEMFEMDGDWDKKIIALYAIFVQDFEIGRPWLEELEVWWDRRKLDGSYSEGFWHLISRGEHPDRIPDFRRSERLPWCGPSIVHSEDPIIRKWDYQESKSIRTYLWLENYDYVIILEKRDARNRKVAFLITAFHIDGDWKRSQLRNKYAHRVR